MALVWKDIPGYEGKYKVSNNGKIKSLRRPGIHAACRTATRLLKLSKDKYGYPQVLLSSNGNRKTYKVHRLVATTFIRAMQSNEQVNHINFNICDNRVENLEICTATQNMIHFYKHKKLRLCWNDVKKIVELVKSGKTQTEVAKMYGIYQADVSNYVNGKRRIYQY